MGNDGIAKDVSTRDHRSLLFLPACIVADRTHPLSDYYYRCASGHLPAEYRPDIFILDLEDSVPSTVRADACNDALTFAEGVPAGSTAPLFLRVTGSPALREPELHLASARSIAGIIFPKMEPASIDAINEFIIVGKPVWPIIETASGFLHKADILRTLRDCQRDTPTVCAILGRDDLAASLRIDRDGLNVTRLAAFFLDFVCACRAHGCNAIGPVFNRPDDSTGLAEELSALWALGFSGALSVFPQHVREVNRTFTPSEDLRARCRSIHTALLEAQRNGVGWTMFEGRKYDTADLGYLEYILSR